MSHLFEKHALQMKMTMMMTSTGKDCAHEVFYRSHVILLRLNLTKRSDLSRFSSVIVLKTLRVK